jgi:putative MATE family efflux protein
MDPAPLAGAGAPTEATRADEVVALRRQALSLALPVVFEFLLIGLVDIVNTMMMGSIGPAAIVAVSLCAQPIMFMQAVFIALGVGATALVARASGGGFRREADAATTQAVVVGAACGLVVGLLGVVFSDAVVRWMGAAPDVRPAAVMYMRARACTLPLMAVSLIASACLRGAGDVRTPMKVNMAANLVNVGVGLPLTFGLFGLPRLEVAGVATGAMAAAVASFLAYLWSLSAPGRGVRVSLRGFRPDGELIRRIVRVGLPAALEVMVLRGGQVLFARMVAGLGTLAFAAHQITVLTETFVFVPAQGLQVAATTLVGQKLGARRPDLAERGAYETLRMGLIATSVAAVLVFLFPRTMLRLFTANEEVIALAVVNARLFALALPGLAMNFVLAGGLRGAGDTRWPLVTAGVGVWGIRLCLGYLLGLELHLGLLGVWIAMTVDHTLRGVLVFFRFRGGAWKRMKV